MENTQNKKPNKYVVLATYLIAVVCMLLGLFLPFFGGKGADGILALQLPDVINKILNKNVTTAGKEFALSYPIAIPGTSKYVDVTAYAALLYVVVTAFSLIALIPVGISTKKGTKTASIFAYIAETAVVVVTSAYVIIDLVRVTNPLFDSVQTLSYSMLVALGGSLLTLIILSFLNKKGGGAAKFFLFLLSAVGVIALYDFSSVISKLAEMNFATAFYGSEDSSASGINHLTLVFEGGFKDTFSILPDAKTKALLIICSLIALIAVFNFFVDVFGLSSNAKKTGYCFNVARYGLQFLALICVLITIAVCKYKIGLMLLVLAAAVVIQVLISVIRLLMFLKRAKKGAEETTIIDDIEYNEPVRNYRRPEPIDVDSDKPIESEPYRQPPQPVYMERETEKPEEVKPAENEPVQMEISDIAPEAKREEKPVQPVPVRGSTPVQANVSTQETRIYTINTIYGGPVDEFMRKLTNDEKVEFAMTFIERSKGNIGNIPEYVIGGNNRLFFSSVFIYLGRVRGLISDGLLNKMYKELNIL